MLDLKFVGPATAPVLEHADVSPVDVVERRVSHAQLVAAGVNPGVAAKIRREYSLSWSLSGGEDLDRRAKQVRGLQDDERAWVAASASGWAEAEARATTTTDGRGSPEDGEAAWQAGSWPDHGEGEDVETEEIAWREASKPAPLSTLEDIDDDAIDLLAEAGITSVRRLATANPERVASSLDLDVSTVKDWRESARAAER